MSSFVSGLTILTSGVAIALQDCLESEGLSLTYSQAERITSSLLNTLEERSRKGDNIQSPSGIHWTRLS